MSTKRTSIFFGSKSIPSEESDVVDEGLQSQKKGKLLLTPM